MIVSLLLTTRVFRIRLILKFFHICVGLNKRFERITRDHSVAAKDIIYEIRYPLNSLQQATQSLYIHFGQHPSMPVCSLLVEMRRGFASYQCL